MFSTKFDYSYLENHDDIDDLDEYSLDIQENGTSTPKGLSTPKKSAFLYDRHYTSTPRSLELESLSKELLHFLENQPNLNLLDQCYNDGNAMSQMKRQGDKLSNRWGQSSKMSLEELLGDLEIKNRLLVAADQLALPVASRGSIKSMKKDSNPVITLDKRFVELENAFGESFVAKVKQEMELSSNKVKIIKEQLRHDHDAIERTVVSDIKVRFATMPQSSINLTQRLQHQKKLKLQEIEKLRREEEERQKREEEERKRKEEELRRQEEERKRKIEEEKARQEKERKRKEAEAEKLRQEEEEKRKKAELEKQKQAAELKKQLEQKGAAFATQASIEAKLAKYTQTCLNYREQVKNEMQKPEMKELRMQCSKIRRKINPKFGQLTNSMSKLNSIAVEIAQFIELTTTVASPDKNHPMNQLAFKWIMYVVTKLIISQAETEIRVAMKSGLPLSKLAVYLLIKYPSLKEILFAKLIKKCPFIIGYSCPISSVQGRLRMGWKYQNKNDAEKKFESELNYNERLGGIFTLWSLMTVTKISDNPTVFQNLGLNTTQLVSPVTVSKSWIMISRLLNLDKSVITNAHFFMLCNWFESSAKEFVTAYGIQGEKLVKTMCFEFTKGFVGKDFTNASKLLTLGEEWQQTGVIKTLEQMES